MGLTITSIIAGVLLLAVIIREVRKPKNNVYIKSDEDLIKQMQDDQIELFNEFTLKVQELRGDFLSNLEGIGMLLEEDYNYINSVNELINSPS